MVMESSVSGECRQGPSHQRRICIVTETYPPQVNGVALTLARLVNGLAQRGHQVSLVRPRQGRFDCADPRSGFTTTLVRGLPLPRYKGLQFGLPSREALRRSWTRHRPDVVYVATEGPLGWSAARIARRLGIPAFSGFHTNYHSYSKYYLIGLLQPLVLRYLRNFHNRTVGTLVPAVDLRDRLETLGFDNVSVVRRGVDRELFDPRRRSVELRRSWGVSDGDTVVLYVGRIAPEKNLGLAIDAYREMQLVNHSIKFVIVGDGPLLSALQQRHPDLIFSGLRTGEELASYYASADLFLFPSETETFGNVTLEAMASGLAVIAYNYAAAAIHIVNGETGVLVPYGDAQGFVQAGVRFVRDPGAFDRMRVRAREHTYSFDWPQVVASFEALLMNVRGHDQDTRFPAGTQGFDRVAAIGRT